MLDHPKIFHSFLDCVLFFRRTLELSGIFRFWQVIVLADFQPTFSFYLGDIKIGNFQPGMFQHILLDLRIGCSILEFGHIHIFQRELNPNLFRVDFSLGKQDNRLGVARQAGMAVRLSSLMQGNKSKLTSNSSSHMHQFAETDPSILNKIITIVL